MINNQNVSPTLEELLSLIIPDALVLDEQEIIKGAAKILKHAYDEANKRKGELVASGSLKIEETSTLMRIFLPKILDGTEILNKKSEEVLTTAKEDAHDVTKIEIEFFDKRFKKD